MLALALVVLLPLAAHAAKPTPCPPARYVFAAPTPFVAPAAPAFLDVGTTLVTLDGCGAAPAKIKPRRRATRVRAKWASCGSFTKVVLTASIASPACDALTAKVKAKRQKRQLVGASRSRCGDGTTDPAVGETCDPAGGSATAACAASACIATGTAACTCGGATTTTTIGEGSTTSTVGPGSTTSTTNPVSSCPADYADCTTFEDHTADVTPVQISFTAFAYSPSCVRIHAGQQVTFSGDFGFHPLRKAPCSPAGIVDSNATPPAPFTLNAVGTHGFYCFQHGLPSGAGMAGAIQVVP